MKYQEYVQGDVWTHKGAKEGFFRNCCLHRTLKGTRDRRNRRCEGPKTERNRVGSKTQQKASVMDPGVELGERPGMGLGHMQGLPS